MSGEFDYSAEEREDMETKERIEKLERGMAEIERQINEIMVAAEKRGVCLVVPKEIVGGGK